LIGRTLEELTLHKVKKNKLFIADPGIGLLTYTPAEFKSRWISNKSDGQEEGIALLLEPSPAFYQNSDEREEIRGLAFKNIFQYIFPYRKLVFQLFIGLGVASLLQLFLPFLTQSVVDTGVNTGNIHFVYIVLLAQLALFAGRLAIEFVRGWILMHISIRINISILTDFLIKLMKLAVSFFDSKHTDDILQRMNDHSRIESFLTGSSLNVLFSLINLLIFSVVLAVFNTGIFAVFAIASVFYALWVILFLKKRRTLDYKRFEVAAREQSARIQLVQDMQEIKLNGAERPMRWTWERLQSKLFELSMKGLSLNQWQQAGAFFINEGKNIFITFLSAKAVIDEDMTLGSMLAVQYIIGQLNSPIEQMIGFVQSWQSAEISMERLNEIHSMEDEEPEEKNLIKESPLAFQKQVSGGRTPANPYPDAFASDNFLSAVFFKEDVSPDFPAKDTSGKEDCIVFQNVSFTYPGAGNEAVLKNITLEIPKGRTTAIVGTSGSGKTTLLKLLLKFHKPQHGDIKPDTTLLENISHKVCRSHCGVVMQESFIIPDTIAKILPLARERSLWKDCIMPLKLPM
jgi:ATP-binding cassette subfamily B protein